MHKNPIHLVKQVQSRENDKKMTRDQLHDVKLQLL